MCGAEFTAQKTSTQYCSGVCSKRAYKARKREEKVEACNEEVKATRQPTKGKQQPIEEREFLSVSQAAELMGCSRQNVYYLINTGQLKAVNIMKKKTIIKRSDINALLNVTASDYPENYPKDYPITECYNIGEVQKKYGISGKALYEIIRRNNIPAVHLPLTGLFPFPDWLYFLLTFVRAATE